MKDKILFEVLEYCDSCNLKEKCIEEECVLFRIEELVESDSNSNIHK